MTTLPQPDDVARVIVLVYGVFGQGKSFWCYVAVKPSKYQEFLDVQKANKLNLHAFGAYGEIIVAGEGKRPPEEVTVKVAEVYQTDPKTFFQPMDTEAEIRKRVEESKT